MTARLSPIRAAAMCFFTTTATGLRVHAELPASLDKRRGHRPRAGEVVRSGLDDVSGLAQELAISRMRLLIVSGRTLSRVAMATEAVFPGPGREGHPLRGPGEAEDGAADIIEFIRGDRIEHQREAGVLSCKKYMRCFAALPWGRNWAVAGRGRG